MTITTTKKFSWPYIDDDGELRTRLYFPGQEIDDQDAAAFAKMGGYAEERGEQSPARSMRPPENKATTLEGEGGENKAGKGGKSKGKKAEPDELVLTAQDEAPQN